jgi:hypothetical protein
MVIEDFSNKFVDNNTWISILPFIDSDDNIKHKVFFDWNEQKDFDKSPIVLKAFHNKLIVKDYQPESTELNKFISDLIEAKKNETNIPTALSDNVLKKTVKRFYFDAKNEVYRNEFYFQELRKIQMRIDFARSLIAVVSILIALVTAITLIKCFGAKIKKNWSKKFINKWFITPKIRLDLLALAYTILISIYLFAAYAYYSEETEFDKRVYGYYLSLKVSTPSVSD